MGGNIIIMYTGLDPNRNLASVPGLARTAGAKRQATGLIRPDMA